jgi:uncharacterized protein YndB with AHSA1/START domain
MNIEVDSTVKCFSEEEIVINASVERVFETLADINHWPEWQSNVKKAEMSGKAEVGKKFRWKAGGLSITSRLHTVQPYSELGWTGRIWWITAVHNWYLMKEGNGTRVVVKESLKGFGSGGMRKSLKDGMRKNLSELKERAERQ